MSERTEVKYTGFSSLAYSLIPWALGIGGTAILTFFLTGWHIRTEIDQERRMAHYVGADKKPQAAYTIEVIPLGDLFIVRADFDGANLLIYARNDTRGTHDYAEYHWQTVSPDGTVLHQGYANTASCPAPLKPGQTAECSMDLSGAVDDRVSKIQIWAKS